MKKEPRLKSNRTKMGVYKVLSGKLEGLEVALSGYGLTSFDIPDSYRCWEFYGKVAQADTMLVFFISRCPK